MEALREAARAFWVARAPRERLILLAGGALAAVLLLYLIVWQPIQADRERLLRELPKLRAQAEQFRRDAQEAEALRTRAKSRSAGLPVQQAVEETAKQAKVRGELKSIQALGNDRAQVSASSLPFDAFTRWLAMLSETQGVSVDAVQASPAAEPGQLQLERLVLRK